MEDISIYDYLKILSHRKFTIVGCAVAALAIAAFALFTMPRYYESEAMLIFPQEQQSGIGSQISQLASLSLAGGMRSTSGREVYMTILKSRTLTERVMHRVGLEGLPDVGCGALQQSLTLTPEKEGGLSLKVSAPTSWLSGRVPERDLKVKTAELSAEITNAYIDELRIYDSANALFLGKKNRLFIEGQLVRAKGDLTAAEDRLQAFQEKNPTLAPPEKADVYATSFMELANTQIETSVALDESMAQLEAARRTWRVGSPDGVSAEAFVGNGVLEGLESELATLEIKRATLLSDLTESHPQVVAVNDQIDKTKLRMREEVRRALQGTSSSASPARGELLKQLAALEVTCRGLAARKSALAGAMSAAEHKVSDLAPREMEYMRLLRDTKSCETVYTTLLAEHAKARVTEGRDTDGFIVLDEAVAPKYQSKPRVKLTLAVAVVMGAMLGVLAASLQGLPKAK